MALIYTTADNIEVRVPDFIPWAPKVWFNLLDIYFDAAKIIDTNIRYQFAYNGLNDKYRTLIAGSKKKHTYKKLKLLVIAKSETVLQQKAKEWVQCSRMAIYPPTMILKALRGFASLKLIEHEDVPKLWEQKLPKYANEMLSVATDLSEDSKSQLANTIVTKFGSEDKPQDTLFAYADSSDEYDYDY